MLLPAPGGPISSQLRAPSDSQPPDDTGARPKKPEFGGAEQTVAGRRARTLMVAYGCTDAASHIGQRRTPASRCHRADLLVDHRISSSTPRYVLFPGQSHV